MSEIPENEKVTQETQDSVVNENDKEVFNLKKEVLEWIYTIVIALAIAFVIKGFLFDVVRVDGPSMENTLINNDRLIITKLGYKPQSQDIIILDSTYEKRQDYYEEKEEMGKSYNWFTKSIDYMFELPQNLKKRYYVKRIIGLPGQTVDIVDGKVLVDGKILKEDYIDSKTNITDKSVEYPVTVKEGHVFVMGDNRPHSLDSRSSSLGQVPIDAILGKAQLRIWPLNSIGLTQ